MSVTSNEKEEMEPKPLIILDRNNHFKKCVSQYIPLQHLQLTEASFRIRVEK